MLRSRLLAFGVAFTAGLIADFLVGFIISATASTLIGAVIAGLVYVAVRSWGCIVVGD